METTSKRVAIVLLGDFFFDARAINMSLAFVKKKYSVNVFCTDKKPIHYSQFKNIRFHYFRLKHKTFYKYIEFIIQTTRFLKKNNYDILVAGDLYSLAGCVFNKKQGRLVYDSREIYTKLAAHEKKPLIRFCVSIYEKMFFKYVDRVLVTADSDLEYLKNNYLNYKQCSWHTIYNYPALYRLDSSVNIRKKYSVPDHLILVVYQGVLQGGRGIKQLLHLSAYMKNVCAVIVGGDVDQDEYFELSKVLGVENKTIFIKKVPYLDLINYTACCDIGWGVIKNWGVSNLFSLPNKLFEYSLAGLPVVVSNLPNMVRVVKKHNLGVVVSANNLKEQRDAINFLLKNKKPRQFYQNIIKENYTWDLQSDCFIRSVDE